MDLLVWFFQNHFNIAQGGDSMKRTLLLLLLLSITGLLLAWPSGNSYDRSSYVLPSLNSPYYRMPVSSYQYPSYYYSPPNYAYSYLSYPSAHAVYTPTVRYQTRYMPTYVPVTTASYGWNVSYRYSRPVVHHYGHYYPYSHSYAYGTYSPYYHYPYGW